jgi:glycosyltransferase involved in cell wall biosynthesis
MSIYYKLGILAQNGPQNLPWGIQGLRNHRNPVLCFGRNHLPGALEVARGGLAKYQLLRRFFPTSNEKFNILYLVSSKLIFGSWWLSMVCRRRGIKVVLNQNGVAYPAWNGDRWRKTNLPLRRQIRLADYVVYQSRFCKLSADRFLGSKEPGEILLNPVDTKRFFPVEGFSSQKEVVLVLAGSHNRLYRVQCALDTVAILLKRKIKVKLKIAGYLGWAATEMMALDELKCMVDLRRIGKYVTYSGTFTSEEAPSVFQSSHIHFHPQFQDASPSIVGEAMACGLPVVFSATGGTPEIVGPVAGIGVSTPASYQRESPPQPELMANAVERVLENYACFSAAARQRAVDVLDIVPWLKRHDVVFSSLLDR